MASPLFDGFPYRNRFGLQRIDLPNLELLVTFDALMLVAVAFGAAGVVKGIVGGGLPAIAIPILAVAIEPAVAAALMLLPVMATNFWLVLQGGHLSVIVRRYGAVLGPVVLGSALGAQILIGLAPETMAIAIGVIVVVLSPLPLMPDRWVIPRPVRRWLNPVAGFAIGVLGGATVIWAPLIVYFIALRPPKDLFVATMGAVAICGMAPIFLGLAASKMLGANELVLSGLALIPTVLGMAIGIWLRNRIPPAWFQRVLFMALVVVGINLLWQVL